MALDDDPSLVVRLELLGRDIVAIKSYSIQSSYLTSTDGFEFVAESSDRSSLLHLELEPVELLINGASQMLGRIEQTSVGGDGSAVSFRGRDYLSDLVENNVDPLLKIQKNMTLAEAITLATIQNGIDTVVSDGDILMRNIRTGRLVSNKPALEYHNFKMEELKPEVNEGSYEFINRMAARHGATIQPADKRNKIVLTSPNYEQEPAYTITRTDDDAGSARNNVLSSTADRDYSKFPTYTLFNAKVGNPGKPKRDVPQKYDMTILASEFGGEIARTLDGKLVSGRRKPTDTVPIENAQLYRLLYLRDEESRTQEQLDRATRRAISERLKDTLVYNVTVKGHSDPLTKAVWSVDTMVQVNDDICGISEPLWIQSRTFNYDGQSGATTSLECWRPSSFFL